MDLNLNGLVPPTAAWAHGAEADGVPLHIGNDYGSCYFDLHPELTKAQLRTFAAEGGQLSQFRTLSSADVLGQYEFDLALAMTHSYINDGSGAWNNTMSHPDDDHYLGEQVSIPQFIFRMGATERIDVEAFGTFDPRANYGFVGVGTKVALLRQDAGAPVWLAIRPSVSTLIGPPEVALGSMSAELLVSRRFYHLAPFVGLGARGTLAFERSADTDVGTQGAVRPVFLAGLDYAWSVVSLGAQVEYSAVPTLSARVGVRL
jgi:hypothetical protein